MSQKNPFRTFFAEIFGGLLVCGAISVASYGLIFLSNTLGGNGPNSTFLTTLLWWASQITFWLGILFFLLAVIGAVGNLLDSFRQKGGANG